MIKVANNDQLRAFRSMRGRPELKIIRPVLDSKLAELRAQYDVAADEAVRREIETIKGVIAWLYELEVEKV